MTATLFECPSPVDWDDLLTGGPDTVILPVVDPDELSVDETIRRLLEAAPRPPEPRWRDLAPAIRRSPAEALLWVVGLALLGWLITINLWSISLGYRPAATSTILGGTPSSTRYVDPETPPPAWMRKVEALINFGWVAPETDE